MRTENRLRAGVHLEAGRRLCLSQCCRRLLKTAEAQLVVPDPPGKKLGWRLWAGSLAINQILPAFAECEKSRVVALVSGHPTRQTSWPALWVSPKNIYNYQNYDSIKTTRSRHHLHRSAQRHARGIHGARFPGGQACPDRKAHGQHACECQQMIDAGRTAIGS